MLQRGHSGDGYVLVSTLCRYTLRKGDLFVLSWARVQRVMQEVSLQNCLCGVRSILLLPLVCFYVCCSEILGISEQVGAPEVSVQRPSVCGYIPTFTNPVSIYGKIESTALWSEVVDQKLRV